VEVRDVGIDDWRSGRGDVASVAGAVVRLRTTRVRKMDLVRDRIGAGVLEPDVGVAALAGAPGDVVDVLGGLGGSAVAGIAVAKVLGKADPGRESWGKPTPVARSRGGWLLSLRFTIRPKIVSPLRKPTMENFRPRSGAFRLGLKGSATFGCEAVPATGGLAT
jgi:hypothetical protein